VARPSYDEATLAQYFMPVAEALYDDPVVGETLRRLAADDLDIIAAVADVDRSLVREALARNPSCALRR
jgi:hypothetical protein